MGQGKENYSANNSVNATDLDQISKNANDSGGFRDTINAGETITILYPVYLDDTANEWKYSDANVAARQLFDGFALAAGSNGIALAVQCAGVIRGLSGLDAGKDYYVQNGGGIGTTPGTVVVLVGKAISATELLIKKIPPVLPASDGSKLLNTKSRSVIINTSYSGGTGTQTIAHGLKTVPSLVAIKAWATIDSGSSQEAKYDGITIINTRFSVSGGSNIITTVDYTNAIYYLDSGYGLYSAIITMDGTNIYLNWTKTSSPRNGVTFSLTISQ